MNLREFHQSLKHIKFDPSSVAYTPPPGLLEAVDRVQKALASGRASKAQCDRVSATMVEAERIVLTAQEHAVRAARLYWECL